MGVKKSVQAATNKVAARVRQTGLVRRLSSPTTGSLRSRGVEWLYLLILFLLAGGVINAISNAGQPGINNIPILTSPNAQNVTETFIILFTYVVGSLGAFSLYLSGRQTIRARSAEMFFVIGLALLAVSVTIGYFIVSQK